MTLVYCESIIDECGLPRKSMETSGSVTYSSRPFSSPSAAALNAAFTEAANGKLKNVLAVTNEQLVSVDFRKNPNSSIVDAPLTKVMGGNFAKVISWYDNEWGYSNRCVDLLRYMAKQGL